MTVLAERDIQTNEGLLPKDFSPYLPDFEKRLSRSLAKPPLRGLIYGPNGWTPAYIETVNRADGASIREQVCSHGLENHLLQVTQNAFSLAGALGTPADRETSALSDANLAITALTHDLGYADPNLLWLNKYAIGHEAASVRFLDRMRRGDIPIFPIDEDLTESLKVFNQKFDLYSRVIMGTSDDPEVALKAARGVEQYPTPEGELGLVIALADGIDYFRKSRLRGIEAPKTYKHNPYFFLANAVDSSSLSVDDGAITFAVDLKEHTKDEKWTLEEWLSEVNNQGYGWIFDLARSFAGITSRGFAIRELQPVA